MRVTCACHILFVLFSVINGSHFRCDYSYFADAEGYLKLNEIPSNWQEARLRCHLEGSNLASPLNTGLHSAMRTLMERNTGVKYGVFTGIHAFFSRGDFHSIEEYQLDTRTGSCYKFHSVPRTWSRAFMACTAEGGHLAIINSETESKVIKEIFAKHPGGSMPGSFWKDVAFVGFHDWGEHGEFITIQGQTLKEAGFHKFSGGEPNNATTGEFCGAIYRSGLFDDLWCENRYAFICEKDPSSFMCEDD